MNMSQFIKEIPITFTANGDKFLYYLQYINVMYKYTWCVVR